MNIFYLDEDIEKCAQYHADSHVIKMTLESAQILCTALVIHRISAPYKPTHTKHPCVLWAAYSLSNWQWLKNLTKELNREYLYRWGGTKNHKSYDVAQDLSSPRGIIPDYGLTPRPQAMPEQYIDPNNPLLAYRRYYAQEKKLLHKYTKRSIPEWIAYT